MLTSKESDDTGIGRAANKICVTWLCGFPYVNILQGSILSFIPLELVRKELGLIESFNIQVSLSDLIHNDMNSSWITL